jgi:hypothetical protein
MNIRYPIYEGVYRILTVIKSEKKLIKCSIFGLEKVCEAIGQNLQV